MGILCACSGNDPDGFGNAGLEGVELALDKEGLTVCSQGTYPRGWPGDETDANAEAIIQAAIDTMVGVCPETEAITLNSETCLLFGWGRSLLTTTARASLSVQTI